MIKFLEIMQILLAIFLIFMILVHAAKGEGIASIGSSAQMFKSSTQVEKGLNMFTWGVAISFFVVSFLLGFKII